MKKLISASGIVLKLGINLWFPEMIIDRDEAIVRL
jgi:hypothetical protein